MDVSSFCSLFMVRKIPEEEGNLDVASNRFRLDSPSASVAGLRCSISNFIWNLNFQIQAAICLFKQLEILTGKRINSHENQEFLSLCAIRINVVWVRKYTKYCSKNRYY